MLRLRGFESLYPYVFAYPDDNRPRVEYITRVTYPAGHKSALAGKTLDLVAGSDRTFAEHRRQIHLARGATAVVMRRTWTPSAWIPDERGGEQGGIR